jgi:phage shock protein A
MVKLNAVQRLRLTAAHELLLKATDELIEQKQKQIKNLRKSLPSRQNKMSVSETQQLNTRKQINKIEDQILERRTKLNQEKTSKDT